MTRWEESISESVASACDDDKQAFYVRRAYAAAHAASLALEPLPGLSGIERAVLMLIGFADVDEPTARHLLRRVPGLTNVDLEDEGIREWVCAGITYDVLPRSYTLH